MDEKGVSEGSKLAHGRSIKVDSVGNGFYLGPTVYGHGTPDMTVDNIEIFGPIVCV
jgi:acyl-CoA reductase-like NAD-dependent aldehyde dehydrogenase